MGLDSRTRRGEESRANKTSKSGTGARVPRRGRWGAEKLGEGMGVVVARRPRLVNIYVGFVWGSNRLRVWFRWIF